MLRKERWIRWDLWLIENHASRRTPYKLKIIKGDLRIS